MVSKFFFHRNFGTKHRERIEGFEIETEDLEEAIKLLRDKYPNVVADRSNNNIFFSWMVNGELNFDNFFLWRSEQLDTEPGLVILNQSPTEEEE